MLPFVPIEHITILGVYGYGRNGDCFRVRWNNTEYAMKQYDVSKSDETCFYLQNEMRAYAMLQDVWGVLVPKPIFVSESLTGTVVFFGLQLGRQVDGTDNHVSLQYKSILDRLEKQFRIRHNDVRSANVVFIPDPVETAGKDRLVAIDFEDWDLV
jgi:thiamine kinase-like enzyme